MLTVEDVEIPTGDKISLVIVFHRKRRSVPKEMDGKQFSANPLIPFYEQEKRFEKLEIVQKSEGPFAYRVYKGILKWKGLTEGFSFGYEPSNDVEVMDSSLGNPEFFMKLDNGKLVVSREVKEHPMVCSESPPQRLLDAFENAPQTVTCSPVSKAIINQYLARRQMTPFGEVVKELHEVVTHLGGTYRFLLVNCKL